MQHRVLRRSKSSTAIVMMVLGLTLTVAGCSKKTAVGGQLGSGGKGGGVNGANAFDTPSASVAAGPVQTGFGTSAPTAPVASTSSSTKTAAAAPTKTVAVATKKATLAAVPTAGKKTAVASSKPTAVASTKAATSSSTAAAAPTGAQDVPFQIGIYADGDPSHTPLFPTNSAVYGGQAVVFTNHDTVARSVVSAAGEFMSPSIPPNGTYTYTAENTANETIDFQDGTRPYDNGQITVTQS